MYRSREMISVSEVHYSKATSYFDSPVYSLPADAESSNMNIFLQTSV
ncbi:hypothetical protein [Niabella sp.]|nr:hypothetical protein [Niabella sp.]